jgi:hypothetical protein
VTMSGDHRHQKYEPPLFDLDPLTGVTIEIFSLTERSKVSADTMLVTSGGRGAAGLRPMVRPTAPSLAPIQRTLFCGLFWGPIW